MTHQEFDQPGKLMTVTQTLLQDKNLLVVYTETGLPFYWLKKLRRGEIRNPSVNRVEFLHAYLSGIKLAV